MNDSKPTYNYQEQVLYRRGEKAWRADETEYEYIIEAEPDVYIYLGFK